MEVRKPAAAYNKRKYTIEEYLELEESSAIKHEYYKGEIFAMSGAKLPHIKITGNLYFGLRSKLAGKPCQPYNSDLAIHTEQNTLFSHPDVSVICGEVATLNNNNRSALNPTIIFEVLSSSTRSYDKGVKFNL